jgi:prepilin-type N-terminal cleavage/methylation domain-containing protein
MDCRGRRGFTLIELLTVISIIGVLIGVMIPAVQRVREAANRSHCGNNLKQIATAIHSYHDLYGAIPPSRMDASGGVTWAVLILPFIEQQTFYADWDVSKWYYLHPPHVRQTRVSTYFCPARRGTGADAISIQGEVPESGAWKQATSVYNPPYFGALADYAVCAGDNSHGHAFHGPNANGAFVIGHFTHDNTTYPPTIKNCTSRTRFATLTDGLSYTFLVGEKHVPFGKFGREIEGDASIYNGDQLNMNASRVAGGEYTLARTPDDPFKINFGSYHIGVCQFAMADGSVQAVPSTISGKALKAMAVRDDGRQGLPDF